MTSTGRFTLPSEENFAEKTKELAELWGADAIRNSDGTHLDEAVLALGKKIYNAYFPTRAHNEWITLHMDETPQVYLLTDRILAESDTVDIPLMESFFAEQLKPNRDADPHKYWEVVDRTTGEVVDSANWTLDADEDTVHVSGVAAWHEYTVSFLAYIIWPPASSCSTRSSSGLRTARRPMWCDSPRSSTSSRSCSMKSAAKRSSTGLVAPAP